MKKIFTLLLSTICLNAVLQAQTIENFNYTSTGTTSSDTLTNTALGGNIWKRHSGTGGAITWSATGLTYAGYSGSGIGGAISFAHASGSREDANMPTWDSIKTGSVYASFLINVSVSGGTTGDYGVHFVSGNGATPGSDFKARLFFKDGSAAGLFKFGLSKGSSATNAVFTTADYTIGQTYLVVLKYTFNSGTTTDDVASAYIFSSGVPTTEPSSADLVANVTADMATADIAKIYGFAIRQGTTGTGAATIDGIRISDGWYNAPLPATLKSFSGSLLGNTASINWSVTNETNLNGYSIEKSNDGANFSNIGFISAKNSSSASYSFSDANVSGLTYYRLKIVDKDGKYSYSKTITVNTKKSSIKLDIFPNPVASNLTVSHEKAAANAAIKVVTVDGKVVLKRNLQAGAIQSSIDVSKLIKGNYLVVFTNDGTISSTQFVKQ